jgi:hypothetical protein
MYQGDWSFIPYYAKEFILSKDKRDSRVKICEECDQLNTAYFCTNCNCFMPAKTYLKSAKCPMNKWPT